jgi:hypothetical protein
VDSPFEDQATERLFMLVQMLQRTAMLNMALLPHPEGGHRFDLPEAKEAIDLLGALQSTTKGNLDARATAMLDGIVSELRLQFVGAPERRRRLEEEEEQSETVRQTFASPRDGPKEDL